LEEVYGAPEMLTVIRIPGAGPLPTLPTNAHDLDEAGPIAPRYFGRRRVDERVERDGLEITFYGWAYPLEEHGRSFEDAGLLIESLREPTRRRNVGRRGALATDPLFLRLRPVRHAGAAVSVGVPSGSPR